jgi:hypothetical protein
MMGKMILKCKITSPTIKYFCINKLYKFPYDHMCGVYDYREMFSLYNHNFNWLSFFSSSSVPNSLFLLR